MIFFIFKKTETILNFCRSNIIKLWTKFGNKLDYSLVDKGYNSTSYIYIYIYIFFFLLLDVNFDKSTIGLPFFFLVSSILAKFQEDQRLIAMSSIKCSNFEFLFSLKLYTKNMFIDQIVNNIWLSWIWNMF